jgi:hypothetical protein
MEGNKSWVAGGSFNQGGGTSYITLWSRVVPPPQTIDTASAAAANDRPADKNYAVSIVTGFVTRIFNTIYDFISGLVRIISGLAQLIICSIVIVWIAQIYLHFVSFISAFG